MAKKLKPKNIQKVIDKLDSILPTALQGGLDMSQTDVDFRHPCNSPHCVGGWYAIANQKKLYTGASCIGYSEGADLLAKDLGFSDDELLENWLKDNPQLWGNDRGDDLFVTSKAYNGEPTDLAGIIDHFKEFKRRVKNAKKTGGFACNLTIP